MTNIETQIGTSQLNGLSPEILAQIAAECLARLEPGRQPLPLFAQLGRHVVLSTVEVAPLVDGGREMGVVMTRRPGDDPWWPNQWHVPGTVLLPTDDMTGPHDYSGPLERVFTGELGENVSSTGSAVLFDVKRRTGPRGHELTSQVWSTVQRKRKLPRNIRVFSETDLREADTSLFVDGHGTNAQMAIQHYRNHDK